MPNSDRFAMRNVELVPVREGHRPGRLSVLVLSDGVAQGWFIPLRENEKVEIPPAEAASDSEC